MFKKYLVAATAVAAITSTSVMANSADNLGVGVNYGAFSGPTLELSYPITDSLQVRGALSAGMGLSETDSTDGIDYDVKADGGINRLAIDYHPFDNGFFLSAGYAFNNFALTAKANESGSVEVGDDTYTGTVNLKGTLDWDNAPTLSLGWGHSPSKGFGFLIEAGAYFTGTTNADLNGTCTSTVPNGCDGFDDSLAREEEKLKDDVADYDFLPMLQAGITYRF